MSLTSSFLPAETDVGAPLTSVSNIQPYDFVPQLGKLRDEVLYGDVWEQPELGKRDRSLVTCAMLAALYRTQELEAHLRVAITNGVTADEVRGLIVQVAFYAGWPCAVNAARAAASVMGDTRG